MLWDARSEPGGSLLGLDPAVLPKDVRALDINGVLRAGIEFSGGKRVNYIGGLATEHAAVVVAAGGEAGPLLASLDPAGDGLRARDNVVACGSVVRGACSAVQAVADGREAARLIHNTFTSSSSTTSSC